MEKLFEEKDISYTIDEWYGFKEIDFDFYGREALLVCPEKTIEGNKWLYKTEYFGAFPEFEIEMLKRGYYLAHFDTKTRWNCPEDNKLRPLFCKFLSEKFALNEKCVPVGMSCGGMQAVYFAANNPECVAVAYIDSPVMNFLSCPYSIGEGHDDSQSEFEEATGFTLVDMINYRNHPVDNVPKLLENNIPVALICGDSDTVVPYKENGKFLSDYYKENGGILFEVLKEGCDHHPHGLEDNKALIEFIEKYY